ncbi:BTB/POZ domain protein [Klosneuvirus KNV1]|uniref:BTB/POZ domain protein n=1 Tax=Klosneuvirus KNV1 TaxID=1977640 RepID=A0A1V0SKP1_9VIRU|nr:BTB/POZ domain protein [Klosneuvirus KNV1]
MIITINVGGKLFTTTTETLYRSKYFQDISNNLIKCERDDNGNIFIDRCPKVFHYVLNFLRDGRYPFPNEYEFELEFYLIAYKQTESEVEMVPCKKCKLRQTEPKYVYCDFCVRGMMQV